MFIDLPISVETWRSAIYEDKSENEKMPRWLPVTVKGDKWLGVVSVWVDKYILLDIINNTRGQRVGKTFGDPLTCKSSWELK